MKRTARLILALSALFFVSVGCGSSEPTTEPDVNKNVPAGEKVERSGGRVQDPDSQGGR